MDPDRPESRFRTPYINSKLIMPLLLVLAISVSLIYNKQSTMDFLTNAPKIFDARTLITGLDAHEMDQVKAQVNARDNEGFTKSKGDLEAYLVGLDETNYEATVNDLNIDKYKKYEMGWNVFRHKIPTWIFIIITLGLVVLAWQKNLSLIPLLGLESCLYMMSELGYKNWMYFLIWLVIGLIIYFGYSYKNSKLNKELLVS
jgi:APA family basic amino acid/polyamine antiporter